MDANSQRNAQQPGPHWRLQRADPQSWEADLRGNTESVVRRALHGLGRRKLLALAGAVAALGPLLVWVFLVPAAYHATLPIVFDQPRSLADRTKLLAAALGPDQ